jgi:hypothetical protein
MEISAMCNKELLSRLSSEEGQVWIYVTKLLLVFVLIGIVISQCFPIIWNHISLGSTTEKIADAGAIAYRNSQGNMDEVRKKIDEKVEGADARLIGDVILIYDETGEPTALSISLRRIKNTLIFESWSYLAPYTEATATSEVPLYENM